MVIRQITSEDINKLQSIAKQTFLETFTVGNTQENLNEYLEKGFSIEKLTNEVENPSSQFFFVEESGLLLGYLKTNVGDAQTEIKDFDALEIERIYVLKQFHGKKVGQILYEKAIEVAKSKSKKYVWLGVWEQNPRAISFYKKNGFVEFDKHIFQFGNEEQTDIMMKLT